MRTDTGILAGASAGRLFFNDCYTASLGRSVAVIAVSRQQLHCG